MEIGGNFFSGHSNVNRGQSGNNDNNNNTNNNLGWDIWEFNTSRFDWSNGGSTSDDNLYVNTIAANTTTTAETSNSPLPEVSAAHALLFTNSLQHHYDHHHDQQLHSLYAGDGSHLHPDPHLMCLKLGKRHYFEDATAPLVERHVGGFSGFSIGKRGRPYYGLNDGIGTAGGAGPSSSSVVGSTAIVPRCQVEGCHVALVNAKEYHRRHKVCEMHSKSPKVVVLGLEQRFCQQCSRFHVVSEFDDSKRSCRRRLAGHNERRRKSSHDSIARNSSQDNKLITGGFPYLSSSSSSPRGGALSLLSSKAESWVSPSDLSSRSSAALSELIAENRAAILARQLILDREWNLGDHAQPGGGSTAHTQQQQLLPADHHEPQGNWDCSRFHESGSHITLDLMQAPSSAFGFLSMRGKNKEAHDQEEDQCSQMWNNYSLEGAHACSLRY